MIALSLNFRSAHITIARCLHTTASRKNVEQKVSNEENLLKTPKGTRDFHPAQMKLRESLLNAIVDSFKLHGAVTIDTPVFERKEILTHKYGDETGRLIYDLTDQQGEQLSLRYDLTVPFSRYLAMNRITNMKRYQIGKVYRREQPSLTRGRYREFYQCDFDIAGTYDTMLPDSECLKIIVEILSKLKLNANFKIKLNHRGLLYGLYELCGIREDQYRSVSTTIDKLDKTEWSLIQLELMSRNGLDEESVDRLGNFIKKKGNLKDILGISELNGSKTATNALNELKLLFQYCEAFNIVDKIEIDLSLARGLDYYTGIIFEAVLLESQTNKGIGSVAAGGRYDDLVNMFDKKTHIPCVGLSIGVERLFTVLEKNAGVKLKLKDTQVLIATPQKGFVVERLALCNQLWNANIKTEFFYKENPKLLKQLQYCEEYSIPYCVIIGQEEIKTDTVKLRHVPSREEFTIKTSNLVQELQKRCGH